ncbi:hypothetical protein D0Z07_8737 [Hyphodiscus hymeniophilus]|uniref:SWR1-complex protein 3 domain-containing protein n=1 Tax=Hyphodiscus hymeniophilus TaxID=353542 RepID=A0A9P6VDR1_9HELO|nr:hypothetical protein D0Z07_8737 [Hyphodiscus hymeniophilus]
MERERKRKLPARAARIESVSKKRTSTPPDPRAQAQPTPPLPAPVVEEALPKSITNGKPLPTVDEPQPENLSSKGFQTVAESGVLEESIKRSKAKWLSEGIFERYWVKPTKRKGVVEPANNPPKESMTKLGTCQITVEPHIFDAQMYAIKEPTPKQLSQLPMQQAMHRPIIQYGPPNGMMPPPTPPPPAAIPPSQSTQPTQSAQQATPRPHGHAISNTTSSATSNTQPQTAGPPPHMNGSNRKPSTTSTTHIHNDAPTNTPAASGAKDPVIQMLAERAASDEELKSLMRIVANGEATQLELKKFQSHIDELTRLQKARQAAAAAQPVPFTPMQVNGPVKKLSPSPKHSPAPVAPPPAPLSQSPYQVQPQALRSKGPLPSAKPDISGIVFEFNGGSGDRFLFPRFSILEYLPQGQVIASFLIVRKGSSSDSPKYDPEIDYYQPITIRLYAHQGRQLDALQKVVAPPDEVRRYMDDIMDNTTRAEYVLLAMQLPKDSPNSNRPPKDEDTEMKDQIGSNQVLWPTTNPTAFQVVRPVDKPLTEEEQYQNFIATVT